jgi:hypothetical protein
MCEERKQATKEQGMHEPGWRRARSIVINNGLSLRHGKLLSQTRQLIVDEEHAKENNKL